MPSSTCSPNVRKGPDPQPGKPLPGTARFRRAPSVSQSFPNPAAARKQPHSRPCCTLRSIRGRPAKTRNAPISDVQGAPGSDNERVRLSSGPLAPDLHWRKSRNIHVPRRMPGRLQSAAKDDADAAGRRIQFPFSAVHRFRRSPSAEQGPHRRTTCRGRACKTLTIGGVPRRKARRR